MHTIQTSLGRILAVAVVTCAAATPAAAQFYVVQDKATGQCRIATDKPASGAPEEVTAGSPYPTRIEAEAVMKRVPDCQGSTTGVTPSEK